MLAFGTFRSTRGSIMHTAVPQTSSMRFILKKVVLFIMIIMKRVKTEMYMVLSMMYMSVLLSSVLYFPYQIFQFFDVHLLFFDELAYYACV